MAEKYVITDAQLVTAATRLPSAVSNVDWKLTIQVGDTSRTHWLRIARRAKDGPDDVDQKCFLGFLVKDNGDTIRCQGVLQCLRRGEPIKFIHFLDNWISFDAQERRCAPPPAEDQTTPHARRRRIDEAFDLLHKPYKP